MLNDVKIALSRSSATIVSDTLGAISLLVLLLGALHLPGMI
ncbi:hypothetical protein ALP8811_01259 [Aliiroseovarius pelagivivens]|uniref:Uncharacterized protein n=1 Tax=Aliiroseovarius pelagivivens TaxID=1639690 RepID=A0A2R8AK62_9RHOB|nr:hypothetical protein [Aliiroseovarius pelagivivens]SPF76257.1 hypothetical protein ALP8811_01259 [Aliiroseovarius pelagivivens]